MGMTWRKVWRDLWHNKLRTLLVVLATTVGVFTLGFVFGSSGVMREQMTESHRASQAPHLEFYTSRFDQDMVDAILREPGVADAEGENWSSFRWRPEGEKDWREGWAIARGDYHAQHMYPVQLLEGEWPDGRMLAVERMSSRYFDLPLGTPILVEVGQRERRVTLTGVMRHPYVPPPQIGMGEATFCTTPEMVSWLTGEEEGFTTLNVRLESFSQEMAEEAAERIKDRLERAGLVVGFYDIVDPDVHWGQDMMDATFLILTVLGALSLALSGFLIINVMNATIAQQIWQIGVMKVVGATFGRVVRIYLATVAVYGLLSLFLAVPLGILAAHLLSVWLLDLFNIVVKDVTVMPAAIGIQFAVGLVVPVVAAAVPVVIGARISPHQAIGTHGLGHGMKNGPLDRLLSRIRRLPRPMALSLRNTFRRKARVALTLLALVLGGVMFIMVLSLSSSFSNTIEVLLSDFGFDVLVEFDRPYHVARLIEVTESTPGVDRAEVWDRQPAQLALDSGEELDVGVWGVPSDSVMFNPRVVRGRALLPDDDRAILLNNKIAADEGFQVGDEIKLTIGGRESTWTVVGLILNINNDHHDNFAPFGALAQATGSGNRGALVMVQSEQHGAGVQAALTNDLRQVYKERRVAATYFETADQLRERELSAFDIITYLMLAMAVLAAVVGGVGLASTMAINVVERGREIGVMRSIGATSPAIAWIFVAEGMLIGLLSWLLAAPLSYPGARAFSQLVGVALLDLPLDFSYSVGGMALWLALVIVLSALASLWPALRATRVSVRESLAYE